MCFFSKIPKAYSCSFEIDKQVKAQSFAFLALHKKSFPLRISSVNVTKIQSKLRIWSYLLKIFVMENFCAVQDGVLGNEFRDAETTHAI